MHALFIILNKTEYLEDILSIFVRLHVKGATIVESQGMASAIVNSDITDIPLFGSLKTLLKGRHPYNKTIFTVIKDHEKLEKVAEEIRLILRDEDKPGVGFMFTVPVDDMFLLN
jgi:nitrogen regulatory protein PII